jgi:hypothetical protein
MNRSKRIDLDYRLDSGAAISGAWSLRVPVYAYQIVNPAAPKIFRARKPSDFRWAGLPGGVLLAKGWNEGPLTAVRRYVATQHAAEILTASTACDVDDDDKLLEFVNTWGVLGCVGPFRDLGYWDSVALTRDELRTVGRLARWLSAMQGNRWTSPDIPRLSERVLRASWGLERKIGRVRRGEAWAAFGHELNQRLDGVAVYPSLGLHLRRVSGRVRNTSVSPELHPRCLRELLWVELWRAATASEVVLRECHGCRGFFSVAVTNHKKRYCSILCKNRAGTRRWYKKPANRRKLSQKRRSMADTLVNGQKKVLAEPRRAW